MKIWLQLLWQIRMEIMLDVPVHLALICWDRNGECVDNTVLLADDKTEGIFYAEFDMEAIRDYRRWEMLGNTFRKVRSIQSVVK